MLKRTITALVAFAVFLPILIFSSAQYYIFEFAMAIISVVAVYEIVGCTGIKKNLAVSIPLILLGLAPIAVRRITDTGLLVKVIFASIAVVAIWLYAVATFSKGKISFSDLGAAFMATLYTVSGLTSIVFLRDLEHGQYIYLLAFLGAWATDIFAYFSGVLFGKHKLIPEVSPKKTVEGAVGGTICSAACTVIYGVVVNKVFKAPSPDVLVFALAGLAMAVVSQIGDLTMSQLKRKYGIKDFGKIFPGHGGVLDRFDSVLAVSLILAVFCAFVKLF